MAISDDLLDPPRNGLGEAIHHEVFHDQPLTVVAGQVEEGGAVTPKGLGRWHTLLSSHRPYQAAQRCSTTAPVRRAFFEATVARTHTLLFLPRWVARSSVGSRVARRLPGRHSSVTASPLRCRSGLVLRGAEAREGRHLGVLKVVFCPQAHAGHVS